MLLEAVGPKYEFLWVDMGTNGRSSDGTIWQKCDMKCALGSEENPLNLPEPRPLPGRKKPVPFICTGDDAFALTKYMIKPYPQSGLTTERRVFNYRLSRMRRISENAFGILANRWRVFRSPIQLSPEKVTKITLASVTLHNFLLHNPESRRVYAPGNIVDVEDPESGEITPGMWRNDNASLSWIDFTPGCSNKLKRNLSGKNSKHTLIMKE